MHRAHARPARIRRRDESDSSAWSACVEGCMFIVLNEDHQGELERVPLRDSDGAPLPCSAEEIALGGQTPNYRVCGERLVKA